MTRIGSRRNVIYWQLASQLHQESIICERIDKRFDSMSAEHADGLNQCKLTKQVILYFPAVELRYDESYSITDAILGFWFFNDSNLLKNKRIKIMVQCKKKFYFKQLEIYSMTGATNKY